MAVLAPEHPLDERLACAAVVFSLDPGLTPEEVTQRLVHLAAGNRTAVERALRRVTARRLDRAAQSLRLTLARGTWAW